jgi:hypothetical protein
MRMESAVSRVIAREPFAGPFQLGLVIPSLIRCHADGINAYGRRPQAARLHVDRDLRRIMMGAVADLLATSLLPYACDVLRSNSSIIVDYCINEKDGLIHYAETTSTSEETEGEYISGTKLAWPSYFYVFATRRRRDYLNDCSDPVNTAYSSRKSLVLQKMSMNRRGEHGEKKGDHPTFRLSTWQRKTAVAVLTMHIPKTTEPAERNVWTFSAVRS